MPEAAALGASTYALIAQELANIGIKVNNTSYQGNEIFTAILAPKYRHLLHPPARPHRLSEDPHLIIAQTAHVEPINNRTTCIGYIKPIQFGFCRSGRSARARR